MSRTIEAKFEHSGLPNTSNNRHDVPARLFGAGRGETSAFGTVFRKLQAIAYVEEDVVGFWVDVLRIPEAVVLLDVSQESFPLCEVLRGVGLWWTEVEAVDFWHDAEMDLQM